MALNLETSAAPKSSPILQTKTDQIDRAWWILLGASLCMFCGQPAVILFTFGTFASEITAATSWPRVELAAAIGPATIMAALLAPFVGQLADKVGARRLAIIGGPAFALGFVLMGYFAVSSFTFTALLTLTCGLGFAATPVLYAQFASGWFARRRGLALSLVFASSSLGIMFWSPYAIKLINLYGWRAAYAMMGLTAGAIIFLSALLLLRNPPKMSSSDNAGQASGLTLGEAVRGATFWKIVAIFGLTTMALAGATVNMPVFLRQINVSGENAALVVSLAGFAMLVGRLAGGILLDRWFAPHVASISIVLPLIAFSILSFDQSKGTFILAAIMIGVGLGAELDVAAYIVSRAFGLRAFGAIYGMVTLSYGLASAIGPGATGVALGSSVAPHLIFGCLITLLVLALLLLLTIRRENLPYDVAAPSGRLGNNT
jgi:MFS family permease